MNARLADKAGFNLSNLREAARLPDLLRMSPWALVIMRIIHEHRHVPGAADFVRNAALRESSLLVCDKTLLPALEFLDVEPLLDILFLLVNLQDGPKFDTSANQRCCDSIDSNKD